MTEVSIQPTLYVVGLRPVFLSCILIKLYERNAWNNISSRLLQKQRSHIIMLWYEVCYLRPWIVLLDRCIFWDINMPYSWCFVMPFYFTYFLKSYTYTEHIYICLITLYENEINPHYPLISPSAAYMRHWIRSVLVQIMACRLVGAKPLPKPVLGYSQMDCKEQNSAKL